MEALVEAAYFSFLDVPNLKLKRPTWLHVPSATVVFGFVLLTYFMVTGGVVYDVIVEPPSIGSTTDERGNSRPVAFMPHRVNGQYIMEGLAASFMFTLGGLGFIVLEHSNSATLTKLNRTLMIGIGFGCTVVPFFVCRMFMRMKLPGYLSN